MRVLMLTAMYPTPEQPNYGAFIRAQVEMLRAAGLDIQVFVPRASSRAWTYFKGVVQLQQMLARQPADLIHAHYSYGGIVARLQRRVPVVVSFMGCDLLGSVGADGKHTWRGYADRALSLGLSLLVDGVIVKSPEMAHLLPRADVHVIPNEVDFTTFQPGDKAAARATLGLDPQRPYFLFAANPDDPRKGFALAEQAMQRVRAQQPDAELLVVFRETQPRLAHYMNACDALVFPSYQEGSPNIVKQAMACNLPLVATDVGDISELTAGVPGCIMRPRDADAWATALRALLAAGTRSQGRQAIRHLSREQVAQRIIAVYTAAMHTSARPRPEIISETQQR